MDLNSSISLEAFDVCEGDLFCIFDIAATGNMAIGLTTLSGSQELEMINNLSTPGLSPCRFLSHTIMHAHNLIIKTSQTAHAPVVKLSSNFPGT